MIARSLATLLLSGGAYILIAGAATVPQAPIGSVAEAGVCTDRINESVPEIPRHCINLNMSNSDADNPEIVVNKDATCDLGIEMPGVPNVFDGDYAGPDSCEILQGVTGAAISEAKRRYSEESNDLIDRVRSESGEELEDATGGRLGVGAGGDVDVDASEQIVDEINRRNDAD